MIKIDLQNKAQSKPGIAEKYWFENEKRGIEKRLFHSITIPLTPFNSGLEYESQPVETEIVMEWLNLNLADPDDLDNLEITTQKDEWMEASIYVGCVHNWCEVLKLTVKKKEEDIYEVTGEVLIDFKSEGVAQNESFSFQTMVHYQKNKG